QNPNRPHRRTLLQLRPTLAGGRQHATQIALVFQRQPDRLPLFRFAGGEIGQGSMLDLAIFAIRLAQKVAGVGLAVEAGDRAVDEHYGYICKPNSRSLQEKCATISGYISNAQIAPNLLISIHKLSMSERRRGEHPFRTGLLAGQGTARPRRHGSRADPTEKYRRTRARLFARSRRSGSGETTQERR